MDYVLGTLLVLATCIMAGDLVNQYLSIKGLSLPGFLTAMAVYILITNLSNVFNKPLNKVTIEWAGELSLQLFLAMSLMSMQLPSLIDSAGPILLAVLSQTLLITLVAVYIVFIVT